MKADRRGAKLLVRRESDGKYLLLIGSEWPERPDRSRKPDLPGGIVEDSEGIAQGALRELCEETSIVAEPSQLVELTNGTRFIERHNANVQLVVFMLNLDYDPEIKLSWEHEAFSWVDADELANCDIREPFKTILQLYKSSGTIQ
ncbi:NUDIX domain-containing protein [Candidatus Nomurabacteria bacterium]|nr:NUDIX domain-containing protein [Candidatus Nomurabacteria bacterium]